jgi:nitrite reductase/ring-hydroxylating ferredoxin subunit
MAKVRLAKVQEIPEGGLIVKVHGTKQVLLTQIRGTIYAMNDVCTHEGAPLHEGQLGGREGEGPFLLTCPWHDAQFDVTTGKVREDTPWAEDAETYRVTIEGEDIFVDL